MPLQNRVTPFGNIVSDPSRGNLMGNRGILHDDDRQLGTSRWKHHNWVTCALSFKGRKRALMAPGHYTELFFLDEATALAAGHRPCAECRRPDYERFVMAWVQGNRMAARPAAPTLDSDLHRHRMTRKGQRVTFRAPADALPDGTMIALGTEAWLVWRGQRHRWGFSGYGDSWPLDHADVEVLTPQPTVATLSAGYRPSVHQTVEVKTVAGESGG